MDDNQREYKGHNGTMILMDSGVLIKRGLKGFFFGGGHLRGDKSIPYTSIVAVQYKKSGLTAGYLQLTLSGGSEAKAGFFQALEDENTIAFFSDSNKIFEEAKQFIEEKISHTKQGNTKNNNLDELEKLADLKKKGIITETEFTQKKKQILGL